MADNAVGDGARYWAFISYSHKDAAFGRRLHRRLENYALPRRLAGRATLRGIVPRRLTPIFRDREELPAAHDLSVEVRAALAVSRSLIVVCSPSAAASPWVSREVELFRALHPDRPILAAIAKGEPSESFPSALRGTLADGTAVEPLAADFRRDGDGAQAALLKLVAGIAGIGLDELVQRDAQRNLQRVTAVTATALLAMLVMGLLTIFALRARSEAERQRGEAEGLVEYMLTDLRDKLKGVGRLDVMTAVNERAFAYYADQDIDHLPPDSLERRARILHAMGEDDDDRGNHDIALEKFREARRITAKLLAEAPNDPVRIYAHAQSEYWIGYVDYSRGRFAQARPGFEAYKRLIDRLVALTPNDPKVLRELAFAEGDLCSLDFKAPRDFHAALTLCSAALHHMEMAAHEMRNSLVLQSNVANRHGWLGDVYLGLGDHDRAMAERLAQERILSELQIKDPNNMDNRGDWVRLERVLARDEAEHGKMTEARTHLQQALKVNEAMLALDPGNQTWAEQHTKILRDLNALH